MANRGLRELISRRTSQSATPEEIFSCGDKVGEIGPNNFCWEVITTDPAYYNTQITPEILEALKDCPRALITKDIVDFHFYMIGESESTAIPTILFTSENAKLRKETRKVALKKTRKSKVLSKHSGIKMADYDRDPGCQQLEQLATPRSASPAKPKKIFETRVLYDPSHTLRAHAISIYVRHESEVRKATANAIRIGKEIYLQSIYHVLDFDMSHKENSYASNEEKCEIDYGSDSEMESDQEAEEEQKPTELIPSQEPNSKIDTEASLPQKNYNQQQPTKLDGYTRIASMSSHSMRSPGMMSREHEIQTKFQSRQTPLPAIESLKHMGSVILSSSTLDYSLITIEDPDMRRSLEAWLSDKSRFMMEWERVSPVVKPNTRVVAYLTAGALVGKSSQNSSHIRLPGSRVFLEAYIVRLNGALSYGDCGSLVADSNTGELYGYLVAGCRSTGTAYIIPAHRMLSDIGSMRPELQDQVSPPSSYSTLSSSTSRSQSHLQNGPPSYTEEQAKKRVSKRPLAAHGMKRWKNKPSHAISSSSSSKKGLYNQTSAPDSSSGFKLPDPRGNVTRNLAKRWRSVFLKHRTFTDRCIFQNELDKHSHLFEYNDTLSHGFLHEMLEDYCHPSPSLTDETQFSSGFPRAWMNLQKLSGTHSHMSTEWYSAELLRDALTEAWSTQERPDAYRQLIYVPDLNIDFVSAVEQSALYHQVTALRNAMYNYIACKAAMRVVIPTVGFSTFCLEFSLPHLALEELPLGGKSRTEGHLHNGVPDISFLKLQCKTSGSRYILVESQFTLSIIGWDDMKWAAYAFGGSNTSLEDTENIEGSGPDSINEDQPELDPIAASCGLDLDTDDPIWNPRLYWLRNIRKAIEMATDDWVSILYHVEKGTKDWKRKQIPKLHSPGIMYEALEWTMQAMVLFGELSQRLSVVIRMVERFIVPGGDCDYFADMVDDEAILTLHHIAKHLETLNDLQGSLHSLESMCQQAAKTTELRMGVENSRMSFEISRLSHEANNTALKTHKVAMQQTYMSFSNNLNAVLMLSTNQVMTPVVVVTAYYSTQEPIFGLPRNGRTFIIAVVIVYFVLRAFNVATVLARRYMRSNRLITQIALGQLEKLFDLEEDYETKEPV